MKKSHVHKFLPAKEIFEKNAILMIFLVGFFSGFAQNYLFFAKKENVKKL